MIRDAQSRSDFLLYHDNLLLFHAPVDREGFGIIQVDTEDIARSRPLAVCKMGDSLFYPYTDIVNDTVYMSYTVSRKHIRLTKLPL